MEPRAAMDAKHGVLDLVFLAEFLQDHHFVLLFIRCKLRRLLEFVVGVQSKDQTWYKPS